MRGNIKNMSKNFSGSLMANLVSAGVSALAILIVSKFFGVLDFSYWQLYIFYVTFVGFMHFGWVDGIYLRYGGEQYNELDKNRFGTQFWLLAVVQTLILIFISVFAISSSNDENKTLILVLTGLNCLLLNTRTFLQFVLLATNRIITYSTNLIAEKLMYLALIVLIIYAGQYHYEYLLAADVIAKLTMLLVLCYVCRDIVFAKLSKVRGAFQEALLNISVGIKLMLANIAGLLIIGITRFAIEHTWGVEKFGQVSLALTAANLVMVFIGAMSVVIFPILKRTEESKLPGIYSLLRTLLMVVVLGALLIYYPLYLSLNAWLPNYADSLVYLALLFPICVYEAKVSMLIATYLKALRKEKDILIINCTTVVVSIVGVAVGTVWLQSLTITIFAAVIALAVRAVISEYVLSRYISISYKKDVLIEMMMVGLFILTAWFLGGLAAATIYLTAYIAYILIKKNDIKRVFSLIIR